MPVLNSELPQYRVRERGSSDLEFVIHVCTIALSFVSLTASQPNQYAGIAHRGGAF
jgi:hypothetical protein